MNIVYGYGGMRSDGEILSFKPQIPEKWKAYEFKIIVRGALLKVRITREKAVFELIEGEKITLKIGNQIYEITKTPTVVSVA